MSASALPTGRAGAGALGPGVHAVDGLAAVRCGRHGAHGRLAAVSRAGYDSKGAAVRPVRGAAGRCGGAGGLGRLAGRRAEAAAWRGGRVHQHSLRGGTNSFTSHRFTQGVVTRGTRARKQYAG